MVSEEEAVETQESEPEWDKERQYRDELSAANKREGELNAKLEAAQKQLEDASAGEDGDKEVDWSDYDQLTGAVKKQHKVVSDLQDELSRQREANKALQEDITRFKQDDQVARGKEMLNSEVAALEKEFGTQKVTNDVLAAVEKQYVDNGMAETPPKARSAWIKNTLRLEFIEQSKKLESDTAKEDPKKDDVDVDTGSGNSAPSDEIPEGDFKTVSKAMAERDRRLGV